VAAVLDALKERGEIVTKIAYANWGRQDTFTRQLSEHAVQMVQRDPSPRGDKNGADINLALDALEMAFTHDHINAFAIVSGDSDFIALVNKLKQYDKRVFVVGGRAFTSTILQKNCHEFVSYESLLMEPQENRAGRREPHRRRRRDKRRRRTRAARHMSAADNAGRRRSNSRWLCPWWSVRCKCWNGARCARSSACLNPPCCSSTPLSAKRRMAPVHSVIFVEKLNKAGFGPYLRR